MERLRKSQCIAQRRGGFFPLRHVQRWPEDGMRDVQVIFLTGLKHLRPPKQFMTSLSLALPKESLQPVEFHEGSALNARYFSLQ